MRVAVTLALIATALLFGVRLWAGTVQRERCGAPGGAAVVLSVQDLGAAPSATDCLGLTLGAARRAAPATAASTPPPPREGAELACTHLLDARPIAEDGVSIPWRGCMRDHGVIAP